VAIKHFKSRCFGKSELVAKMDFKSLASTSFATRAALILKGFLPFTVGYNLWGTARALQLSNSSL